MSRHRSHRNSPLQGHVAQFRHRPSIDEGSRDRVHETACLDCAWPGAGAQDVLSRHRTSEGTIVWTKCVCGAFHVWLYRPGPADLVVCADQPDGWDAGARP